MSERLAQKALIEVLRERSDLALDALKRLPVSFWRGVILVLVSLWIAQSATTLFWLVFPLPDLPQPTKLALPVENKIAASSSAVSFESLASLKEVFGSPVAVVVETPVATPVVVVADIDKAGLTKLNVKLHGVFVSTIESEGSAIIAAGNMQELFSVGDEITGNSGVKLERVLEKRVILNNNGRLESLWLFSEEDFVASGNGNVPSPSYGAPDPSAMPSMPGRPNFMPGRASMPPAAVTSTQVTARPDQIPKNIGDVVRFSVHREGGQMIGYRIRPGRDRELFNQVGLKADDIVTSVNGIEVNDPKQIRSVYKAMQTATQAQLTVLRDGQTHSITISLDSGA